MKIYNNSTPETSIENSSGVVCIGGFDGIHLAHQQLFRKTISISTEFDIITFEVIPKIYFNEDLKPLISNKGREKIFSTFNPNNLIYLNFENFNKISQEQFCKYLKNNLNVKKIVVGNVYLGREFSLIGTVIEGKKLGRSLGFPTANLLLDQDTFIPNFGVYAGTINIDNEIFNAIVNIGINPTVDNQSTVKIEAHIFDFSSDIYDKKVELSLNKFIRNEIKFNNIDELKIQIAEDIKTAKKYF